MGRKVNSGLSLGVRGQISFDNYELLFYLKQQIDDEIRRKVTGPDFYVGLNGKILSSKYQMWIGKSQRDSMLKKVKNKSLKNVVSQLYRPGSFIGDGGTASVVLFERRTGLGLGTNGNTHEKKARDMIKHIKNKVLTQKMSNSDRKTARKILKNLERSLIR